MKGIKQKQQFSTNRISRSNEKRVDLVGLTEGEDKVLIFADSSNQVVRSFNLRSGKLATNDVYRCLSGENVEDVVYGESFRSLFIAASTQNPCCYCIITLAYFNDRKWQECSRRFEVPRPPDNRCTLRALSNGNLVFGEWNSDILYLLNLNSSRQIKLDSSVRLSHAHSAFDVKLSGREIWAAAVHEKEDLVVLYRIEKDRAVVLSKYFCQSPRHLLFCGNCLLVCQKMAQCTKLEVQLLEFVDARLMPRSQLLTGISENWLGSWAVHNTELITWNFTDGLLDIYSIISSRNISDAMPAISITQRHSQAQNRQQSAATPIYSQTAR